MGSPTGRKRSVSAVAVSPIRWLAIIVSALVCATIIVGLYIAGAPGKERMRQFDNQRLGNLQAIASAVDWFYERNQRVPKSLEEVKAAPDGYLGKPGYFMDQTLDPETKLPYEYRMVSDTMYELCATFALPTEENRPDGYMMAPRPVEYSGVYGDSDWTHAAGRHCFTMNAQARTGRIACSLTNPCAAGQTCASLPNRSGSVCVPTGKECLAAGCPDSCIVAESYPVQVRCEQPQPVSQCELMRNRATGAVDCFGCGSRVCKDPAPDWERFDAPSQSGYVGIPYACYDDPEKGCSLAQ